MSVAISWVKKVQLADCDISVGFLKSSHIKTYGSESRGPEEAACMHGLRDHYSELFTGMAALKF